MNNRVAHSTLSAALSVPEEGVARPGRGKATSAFTQIAALDVGESWSRCEAAPGAMSLGEYAARSPELREALRNSVNGTVHRVKTRTGGTYSIETGDFISSARSIYLVCVVTRVG